MTVLVAALLIAVGLLFNLPSVIARPAGSSNTPNTTRRRVRRLNRKESPNEPKMSTCSRSVVAARRPLRLGMNTAKKMSIEAAGHGG